MVDHSNTLVRVYSGALTYYLVLLELDHVDYPDSTTYIKIKVAKVDINASVQRIWPYQHIKQLIQLPPIW